MTTPLSELKKKMPIESQRRVDQRTAQALSELRLAELRKAVVMTQVDVAKSMGITQAAVSSIENNQSILVTTLKRYVEHLGAVMILTARFPDGTEFPINDVTVEEKSHTR
jgi:transcriptional regulator with XRE-family HTH domain